MREKRKSDVSHLNQLLYSVQDDKGALGRQTALNEHINVGIHLRPAQLKADDETDKERRYSQHS